MVAAGSDLRSGLLDVQQDGVSTVLLSDGVRLVEHGERVVAAVLGCGNIGLARPCWRPRPA